MKQFNKKIIIGDFIIRKNRAKTKDCNLCNEEIKEDDVIIINTKRKEYSNRLHLACFYPYIDNEIINLNGEIKNKEKKKNEYEKLSKSYERLAKNIPEKVKKLNEDINKLRKTKDKIIEVLDKHNLLSDVIVEKL